MGGKRKIYKNTIYSIPCKLLFVAVKHKKVHKGQEEATEPITYKEYPQQRECPEKSCISMLCFGPFMYENLVQEQD